jgi:hypothetical protein
MSMVLKFITVRYCMIEFFYEPVATHGYKPNYI